MSLNISSYGPSNSLQLLNLGIKNIESQQADVAWQASAGTVSDSISGLGSSAGESINLSSKLSEYSAYQGNISSVQSRLKMSSSALTQMTSSSQDMTSQVLGLMSTENSSESGTNIVSSAANNALSLLANTLNTKDGNGYIFSGNDTNTKPLSSTNDLMNSDLGKSIQNLVSGLTASNASDIMKQATDLFSDSSKSVFSKSLSGTPQQSATLATSVVIGSNGQTTTNGPVATQGGAKTDTSTGSPIKDMMRDLMVASSLKGMSSNTPGYNELVKNLHSSMQQTSNELIDMNGTVGVQQNDLTKQQGIYATLTDMTKSQLSNNLDVDAAQVATKSNDLQTQLKASFMLIADMKNMTLANYI